MYYTIDQPYRHQVKIQTSEFICFLYSISDIEQTRQIVSEYNHAYPSSTHYCLAYSLGDKRQFKYYSDAGEPSGTAGKTNAQCPA